MLFGTREIILPNTLKIISNASFYNCSIRKIILPETLERIGRWSFNECSMLENVEIKESSCVKSEEIFVDCPNLKSVKMGGHLPENYFERIWYEYCDNIEGVYLESSELVNAFYNADSRLNVALETTHDKSTIYSLPDVYIKLDFYDDSKQSVPNTHRRL